MAKPINIDEYRYEDIYPSFKAGTDEIELTSALNQRFLRGLWQPRLLAPGTLRVADLGCGPCDTILRYLDHLEFVSAVDIRAVDFNSEYTAPVWGKAVLALAEAQRSKRLPIADFAVRQGDAFAGRLRHLLSPQDRLEPPANFHLVFASHMLYHAGAEAEVEVMIDDVVSNLLSPASLLLAYHGVATPGSMNYFRHKFGRHSSTLDQSDTPAVNVADPAPAVAGHCARRQFPCQELDYPARVLVPGLTDTHWRSFARPEAYACLAEEDPVAEENLKRLLFVTQRAPREFAADRSERGLQAYLDEIRQVVEGNAGWFPHSQRLQVICSPQAPSHLISGVREALDEARLPAWQKA